MGRLFRKYRDLNLWKKMLLGYVTVIVLPFIVFTAVLMYEYSTRLNETHVFNEQRAIQQAYGNLAAELSQLKSYYRLFQNDNAVIRYMNGWYGGVGEEMVDFLTHIRPLFAFIYSSAQDVSDVTVYCLKKPMVPLGRQLVYKPEAKAFAEGLNKNGSWIFEKDESGAFVLKCRTPLYSGDFSRLLGYFELTASSDIPVRFLSNGTPKGSRYMLAGGSWHKILYGVLQPDPVAPGSDPLLDAYLANPVSDGILVSRAQIPEIDAVLLSVAPAGGCLNTAGFGVQAFFFTALFVILTALYFLIISSFTKRLRLFSKYIAKTNHSTLMPYESAKRRDEIGDLISVYNEMILRIRKLVSELNIAELKKREADYFTLQAQMRPHFLYNSLETARMIADSNGDEEVGDFLYNLGGFIRYSFTSADREVSLKTELETAEKYLSIYKASMGDRLIYEIDIGCDVSGVSCPPFIVQPLVENCIRHAFGERHMTLRLTITAGEKDGVITVAVKDDGVGISQEKMKAIKKPVSGEEKQGRGSGLGIRNTEKRIGDFFRERASFTIKSEPGRGTLCVIEIKGRA